MGVGHRAPQPPAEWDEAPGADDSVEDDRGDHCDQDQRHAAVRFRARANVDRAAMRQRIEGLAGTLQVESEPGSGTGISACIPVGQVCS